MADDTDMMPEGYIDALLPLMAGVPHIPVPTWKPITEIPPEWRDGRDVLISQLWDNDTRSQHLVQWVDRGGGSGVWHDGEYAYEPDLYLHFKIPEVTQ